MNTIEDGKTTTSGLSLVTCYNSLLLYILVISVLIVSCIVVFVLISKRKKHKRGRKH